MVEWKQGQTSGMIKKLKVGFILNLFKPFYYNINCCYSTGLKRKKEQFESELEELGSIREMQLKESETSGRISGLEKKIQYADIEKVTQPTNIYCGSPAL